MTTLLAGIVVFFGIHLFTSTPLRSTVVGSIGDNAYKGLFSVISIIGLGLIVWGFGLSRAAPEAIDLIYTPAPWGPKLTSVLTLAALIMLAASHGKGHIRKLVKQPMSLGIGLWAIGHLISNGQFNEVMLFGSFLAYAIYDFVLSTIKGKTPAYVAGIKGDIVAIIVGTLIFAVIFYFHASLFGVPVI